MSKEANDRPEKLAADAAYYERLAILHHWYHFRRETELYESLPIPSEFKDNQFVLTSRVKRRLSSSMRAMADIHLPVADALALFSVHSGNSSSVVYGESHLSDAAAVHLKQVGPDEVNMRLAKNIMDQESAERAERLTEEFNVRIKQWYAVVQRAGPEKRLLAEQDAQHAALLGVICEICKPKMLTAADAVPWSSLVNSDTGLLGIFEGSETSENDEPDALSRMTEAGQITPDVTAMIFFETVGKNFDLGDARLLALASRYSMKLSELCVLTFRNLDRVRISEKIRWAGKDSTPEETGSFWIWMAMLSAICSSNYINFYASRSKAASTWKNFLLYSRKLSAYFEGLRTVWNFLVQPVEKGLPPMKLSLTVIPGPPSTHLTSMCTSARTLCKVVNDFIRNNDVAKDSREEISEVVMEDVFPYRRLSEPEEYRKPTPYHAELRIADLLLEEGATFAVIGTSEGSCFTCGTALDVWRETRGVNYYTSSSRDWIDLSLLPENEAVRLKVRERIDKLLMIMVRQIQKAELRNKKYVVDGSESAMDCYAMAETFRRWFEDIGFGKEAKENFELWQAKDRLELEQETDD
ncbi:hypothetical protein BJ508DRAFT_331109 [Ascobolus immersus RN42]|uniref:Uncharacterized protein n=1 Tax=Ascobolus immersus RN42 TaxID=1160509 RepID=A0A3N4HT15_ASCIM|nr:hypothetical protein BJ508DRAFT_331109 [Ascobolus immersus RN42]